MIFVFFEIFPKIPSRLNLLRIHYYALKERYQPDPELVFRIKPRYVYKGQFSGDISGFFSRSSFIPLPYEAHYDQNGFRNNHDEQKTDMIVLGDSYMEVGLSNEDTFAAHLEKISGKTVANYGMGWQGPFQYLKIFKRYGIRNKPDIALLGFFEGNDLEDMRQYKNWQKGDNYYHFTVYSGNIFQRFFTVMKDVAFVAAKFFLRRWDPRRAEIHLKDKTFHTVFVDSANLRSSEELSHSSEIIELKKILQEFKAICQTQHILPVVLFIPTKAHIYLPYAQMSAIPKYRFEQMLASRSELEKTVRQIVETTGLEWISFTEPFEKAAAKGAFIYYETDTHWAAQGQHLAAEYTLSRLKEMAAKAPHLS